MTAVSVSEKSTESRGGKRGWGILVVVSVLLALNGVALFFMSADPTIFEQDTGVPMAEVAQTYPSVAEHVVREGQLTSIMLAGLGLLALVVALEGYRHGSQWAWNAIWVVVGILGVVVVFIGIQGRFDIAAFYLIFAALAVVGQWLARRTATS